VSEPDGMRVCVDEAGNRRSPRGVDRDVRALSRELAAIVALRADEDEPLALGTDRRTGDAADLALGLADPGGVAHRRRATTDVANLERGGHVARAKRGTASFSRPSLPWACA